MTHGRQYPNPDMSGINDDFFGLNQWVTLHSYFTVNFFTSYNLFFGIIVGVNDYYELILRKTIVSFSLIGLN